MAGKYIHAPIDPPRRVEILRADTVGGYWKPGQFGYAVAYSTHPGMHLMDNGPSEAGDLSYLVSKSKGKGGGALWFSAQALRFTGREQAPRPAHARKKLDLGDSPERLTSQVTQALRLYEDRGEFNPRGRAKAHGAPTTPLAQARDVLTRAGYDWRSAGPIARRYIQEHAAPHSHARVTKLPSAERAHARKRKLSPREAKQRLKAEGIDFGSDFHELRSSDVDKILAVAKETGYRKRKDAPGSTARMYFQYLQRQPCQ